MRLHSLVLEIRTSQDRTAENLGRCSSIQGRHFRLHKRCSRKIPPTVPPASLCSQTQEVMTTNALTAHHIRGRDGQVLPSWHGSMISIKLPLRSRGRGQVPLLAEDHNSCARSIVRYSPSSKLFITSPGSHGVGRTNF